MNIAPILFFLITISYLIYGIVKTIKNKNLSLLHKIAWIAVIIYLPVIGASAYLRTTFIPRP